MTLFYCQASNATDFDNLSLITIATWRSHTSHLRVWKSVNTRHFADSLVQYSTKISAPREINYCNKAKYLIQVSVLPPSGHFSGELDLDWFLAEVQIDFHGFAECSQLIGHKSDVDVGTPAGLNGFLLKFRDRASAEGLRLFNDHGSLPGIF